MALDIKGDKGRRKKSGRENEGKEQQEKRINRLRMIILIY
jgi:hypothetical protein